MIFILLVYYLEKGKVIMLLTREEVNKARALFNENKLTIKAFMSNYGLSRWRARNILYNQDKTFFDADYLPKQYIKTVTHKQEIIDSYLSGNTVAQISKELTAKYRQLLSYNTCYKILYAANVLRKLF
jgi:hypothetical protein